MNNFLKHIKPSILARANAIELPHAMYSNSLDFCGLFADPSHQSSIIAEIKFASPSRGLIYPGSMDPVAIAQSYLENGASALSILTEPDFFKGNIETIKQVRQAFPSVPILLKDFVLHKAQIAQALDYGANAVLLIIAFLKYSQFVELYHYALTLGLTPLIEVNNRAELEIALTVNPQLIGINNRNLTTLAIDLDTSRKLIQMIPNNIHVVCASGIATQHQLEEMVALGFNGFLIGTSLMEHEDPGQALSTLVSGGRHAC